MQYILDTSNYKNFKLLSTKTATEQQSFDGAAAANRCLPGDIITLDESGIVLHTRAKHPPLAGHLQTLTKTIYGMTSSGTPLYLFTPFNKAYPAMRVGANKMDRTHNYLVVVKFDSWLPEDSLPRATLESVIGRADNRDTEEKALLINASPYWKSKLPENPTLPLITDRLIISSETGWETINIDPQGCLDIDDTFSWRQASGSSTNYEVAIGISDVAAAITEGSLLDLNAARNCQTIYDLEGRALRPMFPAELSENTLSLLPGPLSKPTVSLLFTFDLVDRQISNQHFAITATQNNTTYTYESAMKATAKPLLQLITQAIQLQIPALANEDATDPHIWIQALMVFYNIKAAPHAAVTRSHSAPAADKLAQYKEVLPELAVFAMDAAKYTHPSTCQPHYGFSSMYCHVTSPIRRYADLINQRALKDSLNGRQQQIQGTTLYQLNTHQKLAKSYQRDLFFTRELYDGPRIVSAIVIAYDRKKSKLHLYVSKWKRIIKVQAEPQPIKQEVKVSFVYNSSNAHYKDRLVCRVIPI